ncbi:Crp/Fnr family transcriptional regulator [Streptomyces lavendulae]|uniref:Crp/Fnr family transcriptional regulator n=1 Tax=Streptomyces lavendulae TaxID=1914 RepID=UPI0036B44EBB
MSESADRGDREFDGHVDHTSLSGTGTGPLTVRTPGLWESSAMRPARDPDRVHEVSPGGAPAIGPTGSTAPEARHGAARRPYLARLDRQERTELLACGRPQDFEPRSVLLRQGDSAGHVLLLVDGWTKVTVSADGGYVALTALHGPGDIVGESAVLTDRPCFATVTALETVKAVVIAQDVFREFLSRRPQASLELLGTVSARLRETDRRRAESASLTVRERVASLLVDLAEQYGRTTDLGVEIAVPLSRDELASAVGVSREMLQRLLKDFRDRGVLDMARRTIVIRRMDLLRGQRQYGVC